MTRSFYRPRLPAWMPWGGGALPVLAGLFVLARLGEAQGILPAWGRWYLDDVLCLPLVLTGVLVVQRLTTRDPGWRLPFSHGILALGVFGFFFEAVLPRLRPAAVSDPLDLVMYAAGLVIFNVLINRRGCGKGRSCRSSDLEKSSRPVVAHI